MEQIEQAVRVGFYRGDPRMPVYQKGKEFYLKQNPDTGSRFAKLQNIGIDVWWICTDIPVPGRVLYTGEVFIEGKRMRLADARKKADELLEKR